MIAAVIPVKNEAATLKKVINTISNTGTDIIIPVFNGCTDGSQQIIEKLAVPHLSPLYFADSLGIDMPRAVGAAWAYKMGADVILFVDGDMAGNIGNTLKKLIKSIVQKRFHLALTDCYPPKKAGRPSLLASYLLDMRIILNRALGLEGAIGGASPSHGPHVVSRRFLEQIPFRELAVPPVALALAVRQGLPAGIGACLPHAQLGSRQRDPIHSHRIAETIIGDCLEALQVYHNQPRNRSRKGVTYIGYHQERRFDLLEDFIERIYS
ncbi:MAG TPA: hypothetical protein DCM26_04750 [Desulfotomaculum sp.]|jgi:hypothetical protein|nr:hypothetical protein [Desulfotomaculum sp.]